MGDAYDCRPQSWRCCFRRSTRDIFDSNIAKLHKNAVHSEALQSMMKINGW